LTAEQAVQFALPIFILAILVEALVSWRYQRGWYAPKDTALSLGLLVLSSVVDLLPKVLAVYLFYQLYAVSPFSQVLQGQWWAWPLLFVLDDFIYYWFHRANHEIRLFWAGHQAHHSATLMNFGTALRQGVGERLHKYFFWLPLPLLGFDPVMVLSMISLNLIYQFWVHTESIDRLPAWIEFVLNTPSHHRVHHASNVRYLDCNHGGVLIIWDRWFGTFSGESSDTPLQYGLTKNFEGYNPLGYAVAGYQSLWQDLIRSQTWRERLGYLLLAPGWNEDGQDRRAKTLRALGLRAGKEHPH
jgi:sterol desaturase/sphingolipid hydroxylase (fatty acid hydroxylase superfamily)